MSDELNVHKLMQWAKEHIDSNTMEEQKKPLLADCHALDIYAMTYTERVVKKEHWNQGYEIGYMAALYHLQKPQEPRSEDLVHEAGEAILLTIDPPQYQCKHCGLNSNSWDTMPCRRDDHE